MDILEFLSNESIPIWLGALTIMLRFGAMPLFQWLRSQSDATNNAITANKENDERNDAINLALANAITVISTNTTALTEAVQDSNRLHQHVIKLLEDKVTKPLELIDKRTLKIDETTVSTQTRLTLHLAEMDKKLTYILGTLKQVSTRTELILQAEKAAQQQRRALYVANTKQCKQLTDLLNNQ